MAILICCNDFRIWDEGEIDFGERLQTVDDGGGGGGGGVVGLVLIKDCCVMWP